MVNITLLRIDPNLKNAWGMAFAPSGPDWVNAEVTGLSKIYNTQGADVRPPVAIPSPASDAGGGHPTGIVFNKSSGFKLPNGNPARFIFVGDDGVISGWNGGDVAMKVKDNSVLRPILGLPLLPMALILLFMLPIFSAATLRFMMRIGQKYPGNLSLIFFFPRVIRHLIFRM